MYHVPEKYRIMLGPMGSSANAGNNGAFAIPIAFRRDDIKGKKHVRRLNRTFYIIASDGSGRGAGWEHVSVHIEDDAHRQYTPTWEEMCLVKDIFWDAEDVVMQLHPPKSQWVNQHPNTLHLWRPTVTEIPRPPAILVGLM